MAHVKRVESIERRIKWALLLVSFTTLIILVVSALKENVLADWRVIRGAYAGILEEKANDERGSVIARQFEMDIIQNFLPELGTVDRCVTCHTGMEDPRMKDQPQPFTSHPGQYLAFHDPQKYGCTVCHLGQGRATEAADAHGDVAYWDYPMLERKFMKATCSRCHADEELYGEAGLLTMADEPGKPDIAGDLLVRGRHLMREEGCLGCHALDGSGGTLSLDITFVGDKTRHELDFSHFSREEPRQVTYWHNKHFLDPVEVAPGSVMPPVAAGMEGAEALTAYMLSLRRKASASYLHALRGSSAVPASGGELFALYCSSCHGKDGRREDLPEIPTPALNNFDSLAVAGDDYYRFIISGGRSGTNMTAWKEGLGNLSKVEIDRIVKHIRKWEAPGAGVQDVNARLGDPRKGKAYFQGLCTNCHGRKGEGGIGSSLNAFTFLATASDAFLASTIIHGRPGTAMPSWKRLPAQGISDLLAYIRKWQPSRSSTEGIRKSMDAADPKKNARIGQILYLASCAVCHGRKGEGGIGLGLNSQDMLRVIDDDYLSRVITDGRPSTAMPAWRHFTSEDVGAIIAYLRTWQKGDSLDLKPLPRTGDYDVGEVLFKVSCVQCHGEEGRGGVGPQLANPVFLGAVKDEMLFHWIGNGRSGTAMKGFLTDEQGPTQLRPGQIADIIAYLRYLGMKDERPILRSGVGNSFLGAQLYRGQCSACHGLHGEGASGPQLNNPTFLRTASDGFLSATIALGRTGTPMQSMVHGQGGLGQITPEQIQDVIAHLRLWDRPQDWYRPRPVAEMSERAITLGKEYYAGYCSSCHGPKGLGSLEGPKYFAPSLNNPEFLKAASDGFLLATIARGRSGTPMRSFGLGAGGIVSLPSEEISDIVSFIRTWQERHEAKGVKMP